MVAGQFLGELLARLVRRFALGQEPLHSLRHLKTTHRQRGCRRG